MERADRTLACTHRDELFPFQSPDVDGLYFVGAGTHPGAGVPGVLNSAKVLENAIRARVR